MHGIAKVTVTFAMTGQGGSELVRPSQAPLEVQLLSLQSEPCTASTVFLHDSCAPQLSALLNPVFEFAELNINVVTRPTRAK